MVQSPKILAICGSVRIGSVNQKLLDLGVRRLKQLGAPVEIIDLRRFELPIYNGDLELNPGFPENVRKLRDLIGDCQGLFVCSPEYNGSVTALLKNMIDWTSRPYDGNGPGKIYRDKVVCLAGASPGPSGGLRGLAHLASVFSVVNSILVPQYFGLSSAEKAFSDAGDLIDPKLTQVFEAYLDTFLKLLNR